MKVRALPTCKKPVGDGAKRTRRFPCEEEFEASDMVELSMVRATKRHRQAHGQPLAGIQLFETIGNLGYMVYLNPIEFRASVVKPLGPSFPPKREPANLARSTPPTL